MIRQAFKIFIIFILFGIFIYFFYWKVFISAPTLEYEGLRWKFFNNINRFFGGEENPNYKKEELWLRLLQNADHILDKDQQLVMKSEMEQLEENDGFSAWRKQEYQTLHSQVQSAITRLQNPTDCSRAKKLICHLNHHQCGFGCEIHYTAYCLITALATQRVLILSNATWFYGNFAVKDFFTPLSYTCREYQGPTVQTGQVLPNDTNQEVEYIYNWDDIVSQDDLPYDPPALPAGLAKRIYSLIREPDAWWIGQFVGYLMRPNETVKHILDEAEKNINFSSPVVGVHVRRGDKIIETEYHEIEEYMEQVELWFIKYEMSHPPTKRRIYLASDDPQVLQECREKYPEYEIFDNPEISKSVLNGRLHDTDASFWGFHQDIHMLTMSNFVVCTHTSNMCLLIYELMHYKHGDASGRVHSLDVPWWYLYRRYIMFQSIVDDNSTNVRKGDLLKMETTFLTSLTNLISTVVETQNVRTQEVQKYPLYKLKRIPKVYNFDV